MFGYLSVDVNELLASYINKGQSVFGYHKKNW